MFISTRGRYAVRVIVDIAEHSAGEYIPLKQIAERQHISQKYLEGIMTALSKAGMIDGAHGKGGGYRLSKPPEDYRVGEILKITEGSLAPVACLEHGESQCPMAKDCPTLPMWKKLNELISGYLDSVSICELMQD